MLLQRLHGNAASKLRRNEEERKKISLSSSYQHALNICTTEVFSRDTIYKREEGIDALVEVALKDPPFQSWSPPNHLLPLFLPLQLLLRHN